jgi:hypothetical protein
MNLTDDRTTGKCSFVRDFLAGGDGSRISGVASRRLLRLSRFRTMVLVGLLLVTACGPTPQSSESLPASSEWREFKGTWTAAGNRQMMRLGGDRRASIANFTGSLLLAGSSRPAIGVRAEVIVFNDSVTGMVGRAVWIDERGDQVYSELKGEGTATGNKIFGVFLGGTGRYAGATGMYEFSWRFVLESEDGSVQGQSVGLHGRIRLDSPQSPSGEGGPRS